MAKVCEQIHIMDGIKIHNCRHLNNNFTMLHTVFLACSYTIRQFVVVVLYRLGYARITHGGLSDTEVQVGRFRIPQNLSSFADNEHVTTDPQHVEEDVRFNSR